MRKIIIICGPTATGKTKLALHLSKLLEGELVSSDSRQVYKTMDIGTGKDIPEGFVFSLSNLKMMSNNIGYYSNGKWRIWGYDLADPAQGFSVADYVRFARKVIKDIWRRNKLPILVGGTGLYISGVIDGIKTITVPRNPHLRILLKNKSVQELKTRLEFLDAFRIGAMNKSDVNNPRRLIRAIEVASYKGARADKSTIQGSLIKKDSEILFVGLAAPRELIESRIMKRINYRVKNGIKTEISNLLLKGVGWDSQPMQTIGYRQWQDYLTGQKTEEEIISEWAVAEKNYAKRQLVWFKKDKRIKWFDISKNNWAVNVDNLVKKWYKSNSSYDKEN